MAFDRKAFRPTNLKKLKETVTNDDSMAGSKGFNDFLELEDGKTTKIRLFPAHPGQESFYILQKEHWLTIEGDNGEPGRRTVLNATVHGGGRKDIIDEYIALCKKKLTGKDDAKKLEAVTDWKNGLGGGLAWIGYALKISGEDREFGLIRFKKTVRDAINKACFMEDEDEPIEVDPLTDPDEGLPLLIKYNSKPNKKKGEDYYEVSISKKAVALTDEELEHYSKQKTLSELYLNVYGMKDFERAIAGLQYFDAEKEIDFFEDDEWLETVEKVKAQFEGDEEDEEDEKPKKKVAKKVVEEEDEEDEQPKKKAIKKAPVVEEEEEEEEEETEEESDDLDEMDRTGLKTYIKSKGLDIIVKTSWSDDDIREQIKAAGKEDEEDEEEAPPIKKKKVVVEEEDEEDAPPVKKKLTLDDIRNRAKNKK